MVEEKFVVIDFVVRRTGDIPKQDGKSIRVSAQELAERTVERVKTLLTKPLEQKRGRLGCELGSTGEKFNRTRQGNPYLASIVVKNATMKDVMKMEDALQNAAIRKDHTKDVDCTLEVKLLDKTTNKYFYMEAGEFRLSGPNGGEWKPFTEWYKGGKSIGLPL